MPYWMTNPAHGVMPVYSQGEVEQAKVHGWELLNEGNSPQLRKSAALAASEALDREIATFEATLAPAKRKPGRPPKAKQ